MGCHILCKQFYIGKGSTGLTKACRGLDIIRAGIGYALAQSDLLFIGEQTRFDDHLQESSLAGCLDGCDLLGNLSPFAFLGPADIDDHIHFVRAVLHGIACHEALGSGGCVTVGKTDDGTDSQSFAHICLCLLYKRGRDTDRRGGILDAVVADSLDFFPGCSLGKQGVVALTEDLRNFHSIILSGEFRLIRRCAW